MYTNHCLSYLFLLLLSLSPSFAFYFSGAGPVAYTEGDNVPVRTVKITSIRTALPYSFYKIHNEDLPFCRPVPLKTYSRTLGQCLNGDLIQDSAYKVNIHTL